MERKNNILLWIFIAILFFSGVAIRYFKGFDLVFIFLLTGLTVTAALTHNKFNLKQIRISQFLLGLLFIFSGFVKGIDPVGTQYRITDYFIAYGMEKAIPFALPLAVILNATEFVTGTMLLFNLKPKFTSWLVFVMMIVFTSTTLYDALYNPVPDCGCFGDAIKLTNWQTLYKNIVIDAFLIIVFFNRDIIRKSFQTKTGHLLTVSFIVLFVLFQIHNINHLPVIDFRDWKVGKKIVTEKKLPLKYYLTYKNKKTGEEKEFLSPDYPFNDSVWMSEWEFVSQRVEDPNPQTNDLMIEDENGSDATQGIIANPDFQFLLVSYDIHGFSTKKIQKIRNFINDCNKNGYSIILLTSSLPEDVKKFTDKHNLDIEYYFADDTSLEAMIRSNPGLVLLKSGTVLGKWHYNDFPDFTDFKRKFVNK